MLLAAAIAALAATACGARGTPAVAPSPARPGTGEAAGEAAGDEAAGEGAAGEAVTRVYDLEPMRIEVVGTDAAGEPMLEAFDARTLLDAGNDALARERPDDALAHYEKLLALFPESSLAPAAHFNIGLAYEAKGEHDAAIERYRMLAMQSGPGLGRDATDAHLRMGAVLAERARWSEARAALEALLARDDLTHSDRIEGMARLGYVALEQKDLTAAEAVLRDALRYYDALTSRLDSNYFVAMCRYYLAQIPHRQFQAIPMRLPDEQLRRDLETKSELVKLAYDRYLETLEVQNVHWATAAGYQMSQIYKELWDDIVLAPVPSQLGADAAAYYVQEIHAEVRVLLEKAMNGHLRNIELAEAYRTSTVWSEASRTLAAELAQILARETSGELVTPTRMTDGSIDLSAGLATGSGDEALGALPGAAPDGYVPGRIEL